MGLIDRNLLPDEQILYRTKKHIIIFLTPLIWIIATLFFLLNPNPMVVKVAIAPAIAALITGVNQWLDYMTSDFAVTNKRILMKEGFFFRHTNDLRLATVSNITVNQSLLGQMLDYGTVVINPFGGENDIFTAIAHPLTFQKESQAQLDKMVR
ncbi:MAG: putative membrane-associated protein [uncultured bacterium]|nr:MAG: putative membrane-associated protein [uncultured bacterium]